MFTLFQNSWKIPNSKKNSFHNPYFHVFFFCLYIFPSIFHILHEISYPYTIFLHKHRCIHIHIDIEKTFCIEILFTIVDSNNFESNIWRTVEDLWTNFLHLQTWTEVSSIIALEQTSSCDIFFFCFPSSF